MENDYVHVRWLRGDGQNQTAKPALQKTAETEVWTYRAGHRLLYSGHTSVHGGTFGLCYFPLTMQFHSRGLYSHSRRFLNQCNQNICIKPYLVIWFVCYTRECTKHFGASFVRSIIMFKNLYTVTKTHLLLWNIYLFFMNSVVSIF